MKNNNDIKLYINESMIKNTQVFNVIKDEIICEICSGILINPKQCQSCESIFCENCIKEWNKKNNSCPKRCSNFIIKEPSKIIKRLLDKLKIECNYCKKDFNYETFLFKHYPECYKENELVKCPFCPDCKIKNKLIEEYKNKYLKEKEELLKQIIIYKERIKELEGYKEIKYKWDITQKKIISYYRMIIKQ